ncbi:hypothetical protein [Microbacterium sp.]|nr:hypothetical protein [Microbacterium sp.]HEX5730949.1 hypothetical protein [Microbacterium sp.]
MTVFRSYLRNHPDAAWWLATKSFADHLRALVRKADQIGNRWIQIDVSP